MIRVDVQGWTREMIWVIQWTHIFFFFAAHFCCGSRTAAVVVLHFVKTFVGFLFFSAVGENLEDGKETHKFKEAEYRVSGEKTDSGGVRVECVEYEDTHNHKKGSCEDKHASCNLIESFCFEIEMSGWLNYNTVFSRRRNTEREWAFTSLLSIWCRSKIVTRSPATNMNVNSVRRKIAMVIL